GHRPAPARLVTFDPNAEAELETERSNFPLVMSPWEIECHLAGVFSDLAEAPSGYAPPEVVARLEAILERHHRRWRALWARFADGPAGWPAFRQASEALDAELRPFEGRLTLPNDVEATDAVRQLIVRPAVNPDLATTPGEPAADAAGLS